MKREKNSRKFWKKANFRRRTPFSRNREEFSEYRENHRFENFDETPKSQRVML